MHLLLALAVSYLSVGVTSGYAQSIWSENAIVSGTMGVHCAPGHGVGLLSATDISATGTIQAEQFVEDGSDLTGVTDRVVSGTTETRLRQ